MGIWITPDREAGFRQQFKTWDKMLTEARDRGLIKEQT